jgi:hypothetical protein
MSSASKVFQTKKILSRVFDFLGNDHIRNQFIPCSNKQILIYGQVQSGKTAKIMEYIKKCTNQISILMIQNSLSMLSQYERALRANNIKFCSISSNEIYLAVWFIKRYTSNLVLLVMNNAHRRDALDKVLHKTKISNYSLIMDESDLYYKNMRYTSIYKKASECVHVTATPFSTGYNAYFDEVIIIPPKKEYISFKKLDIKFIPEVENEYKTTLDIIRNDFLKKKQGIMLITIHNRVANMVSACHALSKQLLLIEVPIVMLSCKNTLYFNKKIKELPKMSISEIISGLDKHQHIIFIANRLASRGINYSDLTYTRHLTHQIIKHNDSKTNFIQRCRILGNKGDVKDKLKLYCFNCSENYFQDVIQKIDKLEENVDYLKVGYVPKTLKPSLDRSKTI